MEKEVREESRIIKSVYFLKEKITRENIKKYSSKYKTPFDNKFMAIVASIVSACCMIFVDSFEFYHRFADWYQDFAYSLGEYASSSRSEQNLFSLFQYNLDSTDAIAIFEALTIIMLVMTILFVCLNRTKFSLITATVPVIIMIITLFRDSYYEAVAGNMTITPLTAYYVVWAVVIIAFIINILAFIKTKKNPPIVSETIEENISHKIPDENSNDDTSEEEQVEINT